MILSLCSGYGGLDRAVSAVWRLPVGWHAETDPAAALVLDKRYDGVPNLGDITLMDWRAWRESLATVLCAGFPCQPFSAAGRQLGESDERYLWPAVRLAIMETRPPWVVLENVSNLVSMRKGEVWRMILSDLNLLGYVVTWGVFGACLDATQGCHHRHRVFAVARRVEAHPLTLRWPGKACGVPRRGKTMLPTPAARDGDGGNGRSGRGAGTAEYWAGKAAEGRTNGMPLDAALQQIEMLPTPAAVSYGSNQGGAAGRVGPVRHSLETMARLELLPTPDTGQSPNGHGVRGGASGNGRQSGAALEPLLRDLLPSPTVNDSRGGRNATANRHPDRSAHHSGTTLSDLAYAALLPTPRSARDGGWNNRGEPQLPSAVQPEHFGRYAAAVARWSAVHGLPPAPTEVGPKGGTRMTAAFPEWMMGLAPGFVTDVVGRTDALRLVGNGVFPLQAYHALSTLLAMHDG